MLTQLIYCLHNANNSLHTAYIILTLPSYAHRLLTYCLPMSHILLTHCSTRKPCLNISHTAHTLFTHCSHYSQTNTLFTLRSCTADKLLVYTVFILLTFPHTGPTVCKLLTYFSYSSNTAYSLHTLCSHIAHTKLIICFHTVVILLTLPHTAHCMQTPYTLLILCSHTAHALLMHCSCSAHTLHLLLSCTAHILQKKQW